MSTTLLTLAACARLNKRYNLPSPQNRFLLRCKAHMRKFLSLSSAVALALLFCFSLRALAANSTEPPAPAQDGTMPALTAIAGQGMMSNEAYDDLEELSDYIGGRVTGSTQAGQAIEW